MYCYYCGSENKEGQRFCNHCGKEIVVPVSAVNDAPVPVQEDMFVQAPVPETSGPSVETVPPKKKGKLSAAIAVVCIIAGIAVIGGSIFGKISKLGSKDDKTSKDNISETEGEDIDIPEAVTKEDFIDDVHAVFGDGLVLNETPLASKYFDLDPENANDAAILEQFNITKFFFRNYDALSGSDIAEFWDKKTDDKYNIGTFALDECHLYRVYSVEQSDSVFNNYISLDYYEFGDDGDAHDALKYLGIQADKDDLSSDEYFSSPSYSYYRAYLVTNGKKDATSIDCIYQIRNVVLCFSCSGFDPDAETVFDEFIDNLGLEYPDDSIRRDVHSFGVSEYKPNGEENTNRPYGNKDTAYYKSLSSKGSLSAEELSQAFEDVFDAEYDETIINPDRINITLDDGSVLLHDNTAYENLKAMGYSEDNMYWDSRIYLGDRYSELSDTCSVLQFYDDDGEGTVYTCDFYYDGTHYNGERIDDDERFTRMVRVAVGAGTFNDYRYYDDILMMNDDYSYIILTPDDPDEMTVILRLKDQTFMFRAYGDIDRDLVDEFFEEIGIMSPTEVSGDLWD